jgi:hypothetical protein
LYMHFMNPTRAAGHARRMVDANTLQLSTPSHGENRGSAP